jgi:alkylmercury lyase-like protein
VTALTVADQDLRGLLTRMIAERGHAPGTAELAEAAEITVAEAEASLRRLHDGHALLLHPHKCEPWAVHPFALSAGGCWVETAERGYWANCLYCGFGIAAALDADARLTARLGGESGAATYRIERGTLLDTAGVFHLSTPVARWWDNVIHACASFQPFADEADIDPWCARHGLPRGAVMSLEALWAFAADWYGGYLRRPWRKRSPQEVRALFARHGLTGPFWEI